MQQYLILIASAVATFAPAEKRTATIAIYGDSAAARSELREHCLIFPYFSPTWLRKTPSIASLEGHLHRDRLPRDWQRFGACDLVGGLVTGPPVFDWVVDEAAGRVFRRAANGKLELFSTRTWLKDVDPAVRSSFVRELVRTGRDEELFPCAGQCEAFQVRWARDPVREQPRAAIERILSLLGLTRQSEKVMVDSFLGDDVIIGKNSSISFSVGRWWIHNLARTRSLPLIDRPDVYFFSHPEGCRLIAPAGDVDAWEANDGWLVHWKNRPPNWTIPFKAVAVSEKEQCRIKSETLYVYLPITLGGKPSVKSELRPLIDVLQHRPLASLSIPARQRIVLGHSQQSGWTEQGRDIEVRFEPSLLEPPGSCSPSDSADGSYHCPLSLRLNDFTGFVQWYE